MRLHGVSETVDSLDGGVGRGIVADGVVGADDIVINGGRNADNADALLGKFLEAAGRAVAAGGEHADSLDCIRHKKVSLLSIFSNHTIPHKQRKVNTEFRKTSVKIKKIAHDGWRLSRKTLGNLHNYSATFLV